MWVHVSNLVIYMIFLASLTLFICNYDLQAIPDLNNATSFDLYKIPGNEAGHFKVGILK